MKLNYPLCVCVCVAHFSFIHTFIISPLLFHSLIPHFSFIISFISHHSIHSYTIIIIFIFIIIIIRFWLFFIGPGIIYTLDKIISLRTGYMELDIIETELLPSDVVKVKFYRRVESSVLFIIFFLRVPGYLVDEGGMEIKTNKQTTETITKTTTITTFIIITNFTTTILSLFFYTQASQLQVPEWTMGEVVVYSIPSVRVSFLHSHFGTSRELPILSHQGAGTVDVETPQVLRSTQLCS